jgi:hypothetical protein
MFAAVPSGGLATLYSHCRFGQQALARSSSDVSVAGDAANSNAHELLRKAAMVAAATKEDFMEPLTTIELATCTIPELVALYSAIQAVLWAGHNSSEQRDASFVNQERIRRALADRASSRSR